MSKNDPRESNGVGKSTIFWALFFVIFGDYTTDTVDEIVRDDTDYCKVEYIFELNSKVYKIKRIRRKEKSTEVSLEEKSNNEWINKNGRTPTETNREIQKLIKISSATCKNSISFFQKDLGGLVSLKSSDEQMSLLKDAAGLHDYKKLEKMAKAKISDLTRELTPIQAMILSLGDPGADIIKFASEISEIKSSLLVNEENINNTKNIIKSKKDELSYLEGSLSADSVKIHDKIDNTNSKKSTFEKNLSVFKKDLENNSLKIKELEQDSLLKKIDIEEINLQLDFLNKKQFRNISEIKDDLQKISAKQLDGKAFVATNKSKIDELSNPLPNSNVCPTCKQSVTDEYRSCHINNINEVVSSLKEKNQAAGIKLAKLDLKKKSLEKEVEEINSRNNKVKLLTQKIESINGTVFNTDEFCLRVKSANKKLELDISSITFNLSVLNNHLLSLVELANNSLEKDTNIKITSTKKEISGFEKDLDELIKNFGDLKASLSAFQTKVEMKEKDLIALNEKQIRLNRLNFEINLNKRICNAFSSSGIPAMIIKTILPDLQIESNKFLSKLKSNLSLSITNSGSLNIIFKINDREKKYRQLSGGQQVMFAFATKLGLSVVIQKRLGVDIKLLLLDEVEPSFDKVALDSYSDIIRILQKDFKVLVITHNDSLQEKFSDIILVENDGINATAKLLS